MSAAQTLAYLLVFLLPVILYQIIAIMLGNREIRYYQKLRLEALEQQRQIVADYDIWRRIVQERQEGDQRITSPRMMHV